MTGELSARELMSVADYLEWEKDAEIRHEYVGGVAVDFPPPTAGE